jgi:DNA-binding GntR family transcriptional regulator
VRTLAEALCVSPMPVREALLRLALEELVEVSPRSSTRVTSISLDRVREICEMRNYLEPLAARLAVPHLTPTDLKHIRQWLKKMDAAAAKDRPEEWHRWNQELHALMFRKCGNSFCRICGNGTFDTSRPARWPNRDSARGAESSTGEF